VTLRAPLLVLLAAGWLAATAPALAYQAEVARYYQSVAPVCHTGVTPAMRAAYDEARLAVERARYGGGRDNNFWGLKSPEGFWLDCFQAPDGKS
jgi:hypothetical protein